jgi:hypothetical protein
MEPIELEIWKPDSEDPRFLKYIGQPRAEEAFLELGRRLEALGLMPDEYFLLDWEWENGREIPKGADIFCTTDYGESEGIYVDVYLKWYEDGKPITKNFATGKTLGETGYDLDRMFLTASAITKAFHGDGCHNENAQGAILDLNAEERKALLAVLTRQEQTPEFQSLITKLAGDAVEQAQASQQPQGGSTMEMSL